MTGISKPIHMLIVLVAILGLSACGTPQSAAPTATVVDVKAVMTSAAATAFVQLTQIAGQASATSAPTQTATPAPATNTPNPLAGTATTASGLQLLTPTEGAGGLPTAQTPVVGAGTPLATAVIGLTPLFPVATTSSSTTCYNSKFVADVTIPDGTILQPYQKFRKIWRIQNTGTCPWDDGFGLTFWAGSDMGGQAIYFSANDAKIQPGSTVDLGIDMRAPLVPNKYVGHWSMVTDAGKTFGGDFTVVITVSK